MLYQKKGIKMEKKMKIGGDRLLLSENMVEVTSHKWPQGDQRDYCHGIIDDWKGHL